MASLVLGRFAVLGETQHHPTGQWGGGERVCPGLCVFARVCFCKNKTKIKRMKVKS